MVHLRVTISLIDEDFPDAAEVELSRTDLPKYEIKQASVRETLEAIEEQTLNTGHEVMRQMVPVYLNLTSCSLKLKQIGIRGFQAIIQQ